jgi:putative zinc finger/helix-turn-helix YgiT family protein
MNVTREPRRYSECGLPNVVLLGVEVRRCPKCGEEEIVIPRIEELHRVLAGALLRKAGRLTGVEVRFLRKVLGWSGEDFARNVGVARETVSRWENEHEQMSPVAERLLRLAVAHEKPIQDYHVADLGAVDERGAAPAKITVKLVEKRWQAA